MNIDPLDLAILAITSQMSGEKLPELPTLMGLQGFLPNMTEEKLRNAVEEMLKSHDPAEEWNHERQTVRVYRAQTAVLGLEQQPSFSTFARCKDYFKKVWKSDFVKKAFPDRCKARVHFSRGDSSHTSTTERLKTHLPETAAWIKMGNHNTWKKYIVLHEIAHLCAARQVRHGPEFVQAYVKLLDNFLGPAVAKRVIRAFKKNEVEGTP